ncbi:MAG: DUF460 domain-containing protein [Candidatus Thorarchaeota archaeon]|jgi:predicted RNase H-like nuclease (RuvC/YqgF family)
MSGEGVVIVGFDILPSHSASSKRAPKFACVVTRDEIVLNEYPEISRGALLKLVRDNAPKWLCTDNIFELVPDTKSLFHLAERIPTETKIVQVTGVPPRQTPLKILAKQHGLNVRGKPTPIESARIIAQLAARGVGYALECFSEQTEIKVTRGRKPGRGGQSANRFRRNVHSQIQQMTRFIESEIKTAGIDYDIDIRSSDFGYASARLIAYSPLPTIRGMIKGKRGGDFNILISPVRKRVEFVPLEPRPVAHIKPKYFILGIDPGTTAAYCLLTLDGHIRSLKSRKGLTRADMIREVYEEGIPAIVASDVPQLPHFVEKIASTVNAPVFTPKKPIAVVDKQELAREYSSDKRIRNAHERDALTAAVYAYRSILPKLQQIDKIIREKQISVDRNYLKALVIKGTSINEALARIERESAEVIEVVPEKLPVKEQPLTKERFDALQTKLEQTDSENRLLLDKIDDLKRFVEYLKFKESELSDSLEIVSDENYWKIKRDRDRSKNQSELTKSQQEVASLRKEVKDLSKHLERLKGVKRLEMRGDMLAVKVVPQFTRESIEEYIKKVGLRSNDIVLFEDASGGGPQTASILIDHEIRAVVVDTTLSHLPREVLIKAMIPVIEAKQVELQRVDEFAFISRGKFEHQLQNFLKSVREQARQKGEEQLVELVERYRREIER